MIRSVLLRVGKGLGKGLAKGLAKGLGGLRAGAFLAPLALVLVLAGCDSVEERVAEHYERGQELLAEGAPEKAILEFANALQLDENHVPSLFATAGILEARGDFQAAFARYTKVSELDPNHAVARFKLARFYMLGNALDKARTELAASLKTDPDNAEAHALAAVIALREGDQTAAAAAIEKAKGLAPTNAEVMLAEIGYLRQASGAPAALALTDEALAAHPDKLAFYLLKLQMLEEMGDQAALGAHLAKLIEAFPDQPRFRQARAQWALRNDDAATAESELRAIVTALPDNREAVATLIRFLRREHGDAAARAELAAQIERAENAFPLELMLAQFDIETGQTGAAIAYLRDLIGRAGDNANEARIILARLLIREGQASEARDLIDAVLASDSRNVDALVMRTAWLIDDENLDQALQSVRLGLTEAPEDVRLLLLAGRVHELSGNISLASDRYAKAVRASEYDPVNVVRYVQFLVRDNRIGAAETVLTEAIDRRPEEARLFDLLAGVRMQREDWAGAERAIAELAKLDPDRARQLRGALLIGQEKFEAGAEVLRDLPESERQRPASITALVQVYMREGKIDEARAFLNDIIAKDPANIQALGLRGNVDFATGNVPAARTAYEEILKADPANAAAHSALARLAEAEGDMTGAAAALKAGLEANPGNLLLLGRLAMLTERQGDIDAAIRLYGEFYDLNPDALMVANNLASLLADHHADDPAAIDRAYRIAGRLRNSETPYYRDTYGWTRYLKGEHREALEHLKAALEALPDNPWVNYHVGMTEAALGNGAEARVHLERALELAGETPFPPAVTIRETLAGLE